MRTKCLASVTVTSHYIILILKATLIRHTKNQYRREKNKGNSLEHQLEILYKKGKIATQMGKGEMQVKENKTILTKELMK